MNVLQHTDLSETPVEKLYLYKFVLYLLLFYGVFAMYNSITDPYTIVSGSSQSLQLFLDLSRVGIKAVIVFFF